MIIFATQISKLNLKIEMKKVFLSLVVLAGMSFAMVSCKSEGAEEKAIENVEATTEKAVDSVAQTTEAVTDSMKKAGEAAVDSVKLEAAH